MKEKFPLNQYITLQEDNDLRLDKDIPAWSAWEAIEYFHHLGLARFRYILSAQTIENMAKLFALSPIDLKSRILLHLYPDDRRELLSLIKTRELIEFYQSPEAQRIFLTLFEFELMVT